MPLAVRASTSQPRDAAHSPKPGWNLLGALFLHSHSHAAAWVLHNLKTKPTAFIFNPRQTALSWPFTNQRRNVNLVFISDHTFEMWLFHNWETDLLMTVIPKPLADGGLPWWKDKLPKHSWITLVWVKRPRSGIRHAELQVSSFFFEKPLIPNSGSLLF